MKTNEPMPRMLIVDDEKDLCYLLAGMMGKKMDVQIAHSLSGARQHVNDYLPDFLFLDNNLPDGRGIDSIADLRKKLPSARIVMMTSDTTNDLEKKARSFGADYFLYKPFSRETVKSIVFGMAS
jgi:two-component system OmpR family response regulator